MDLLVPTEKDTCVSKEELDNRMADVMGKAGREIEELRSTLSAVIRKLEGQNAVIKGQNDVIEGQNAAIERHNSVIAAMKGQIEHLTTAGPRHDEESTQVAFSVVSRNTFGNVTEDMNIPFEITYTNIGGGWSSVGNAFMAPVSGVYEFTASFRSQGSVDNAWGHIVHSHDAGQTRLASIFGGGPDHGISGDSNSVIIEVEQGDYVSVQLVGNGAYIYGDSSVTFSSFSGFLLFQ